MLWKGANWIKLNNFDENRLDWTNWMEINSAYVHVKRTSEHLTNLVDAIILSILFPQCSYIFICNIHYKFSLSWICSCWQKLYPWLQRQLLEFNLWTSTLKVLSDEEVGSVASGNGMCLRGKFFANFQHIALPFTVFH